jgi:hypothetical protein
LLATLVEVPKRLGLSSLRYTATRFILTQKAVLDLAVDFVQPLLRALGLLLMRRDLRL